MEKKKEIDIDELIVGYLGRELSAEDAREVEEWVAASQENAARFAQARSLWFSVQNPAASAGYDVGKAFENFRHKVKSHNRRRRIIRTIAVNTAAAAVLAVVAFFSFSYARHQQELAYTDIVVEAPAGAQSKVTLPDGSSVWLNAGSKIVYKNSFGEKTRKIKLSGEALFDVVKDSRKPFLVHTDNIIVKVLGTTFCVSDYHNNDNVSVALVEGRVELMKADGSGEHLLMNPDDYMSMNEADGQMFICHSPEKVAANTRWTDGKILMDEKYLSEIAGILEKYYGVKVRISDRELYEQRYRAIFFLEEQSLEEVLGALCKASGDKLQFKVQGDTVTVFKKTE